LSHRKKRAQGKALSQWQRDATLEIIRTFALAPSLPVRSESLQKWFEMLGKRLVSAARHKTCGNVDLDDELFKLVRELSIRSISKWEDQY